MNAIVHAIPKELGTAVGVMAIDFSTLGLVAAVLDKLQYEFILHTTVLYRECCRYGLQSE